MSDNKKNVIVIGAGIAGLSAAIYARRSGFDVTIYESHFIPGGLSTSWTRKGYLFEGGMHWLTGSSPKSPLNKVWKELGALQENNPILVKDPFYTLIDGDKQLCLFRDVNKLEKHFIEFAPEDKKMIKKMCKDIKIFQGVHCIVGDIPGLKAQTPSNPGLKELLGMVPAATRLLPLINESYIHYVNRFKNNSIRHLLMTVIGDRYNALSLIYTLATFSTGDCGYPIGGSIRMAQNMAKTFEDLGGKIQYKSFVDQVVIQKGKVKGIMCKEEFIPCDSVIVTQDARSAIDTLFGPSLKDKWVSKMRNDTIGEQNMFICLGVKHSFSNLPKAVVYPLDKPFKAGGLEFNELRINNYSEYKDHAPEGCTTLTCLLLGECYDYWQKAKEDGTYKEKKKDLCDRFIAELTKFMPEIADNIEVTDVATPCTYERYCHTYKGSWMSVWEPKGKARNYPIKAKTVKGLYFAGQRVQMPGGLPIAVGTGRTAAQYLCRDNGVKFMLYFHNRRIFMGKKSGKLPLIYLLGMALVVIGFIIPMFKVSFGPFGSSNPNGFKFIDFDHMGFVTIGSLLVFAGACLGVIFSLVNIGSSTDLIRLISLLITIAGGVVLVIGFTQDSFYQFIGKQFFKHAFVGFYMILCGWVVALVGYITKK